MNLWLASIGIGDAVCALYSACGLADAGYAPVTLHTRHNQWLARASHPGVTVSEYHNDRVASDDWIDIYRDYHGELESGVPRKQWYCDMSANELGAASPCKPFHVDKSICCESFNRKPYVVISPFPSWQSREWPASHWRKLVSDLHAQGLHCLIIDGPGDGGRIFNVFGALPAEWSTYYWGMSACWVTNAMLGAEFYIGVDSGMTHVAGLLGIRAYAIASHLDPELLFSLTDIQGIVPDGGCRFCRFRGHRGYGIACDSGCSEMAGVTPRRVIEAIDLSAGTA